MLYIMIKIINDVKQDKAMDIKAIADKKHKEFEQNQKKECRTALILISILLFILIFGIAFLMTSIMSDTPNWVAFLVAGVLWLVAVFLISDGMTVEETELDISDYPAQYKYWFYQNDANVLDFKLNQGFNSDDKTLYVILEDKQTKEVSEKYLASLTVVRRTDIDENIIDLENNKYFVPYVKNET